MRPNDTLTDAEAQYLAEIWEDCAGRLGPNAEVLGLHREPLGDGVRLVVGYRLGAHVRESEATGDTLLAAHAELRDAIITDRVRFGFAELLERR